MIRMMMLMMMRMKVLIHGTSNTLELRGARRICCTGLHLAGRMAGAHWNHFFLLIKMSKNGEFGDDSEERGARGALDIIQDTLREIQGGIADLKIDVRTGDSRVKEIWSRLDSLERNERPTEDERDNRFIGQAGSRFGGGLNVPIHIGGPQSVPDSIDLNSASDAEIYAEFLALKDALGKYRLAGHLNLGETGIIRGDVSKAKAGILRKSAAYTSTVFRYMRAAERNAGPTHEDITSIYMVLLAQMRMFQYEMGICMVEGSSISKEASSIFRTIRGGNQNLREGDTVALEHACRMAEATSKAPEKTHQPFRGGFRGGYRRGFYNNYRGENRDFRGNSRQFNQYPPRSNDYFANSVDSTANTQP